MAKINILFDEKNYAIDEANLEPATNALKAHFETLGGGEGTLEYGKEYTFKSVITKADCEKYIANAEPHVTNSDSGENWYCIYSDTSDGTGEYIVMLVHHYLEGTFVIYYNDSEKIFEADVHLTWQTMNFSAGAPVLEPTDPPTMPITDGGLMSADLATTSILFDLPSGGDLPITLDGAVYKVDSTKLAPATNSFIAHLATLTGNEGDTKIVINGAEYFVDSAKLADAKSALAAHLGELAKETLSAPFANIDTNTLNIYDDTGLATSFDILVDGEIKASVTKEGV